MGSISYSQSYTVSVKNQHSNGSDFIFDIFIKMDVQSDFYLGASDFSLSFNNNNFLNPFISVNNSEVFQYYTSAISIVNSNVIVLNVLPPLFLNEEDFELMSAKISYTEPGTKVAEITISGINNFSGEAGLIWKEQSPNQCVIYSLDSNSPWLTTEKTSQGNFESPSSSPLPVELSSFSASVEGTSILLNWTTETETNNYGFDIERQVFSSQSGVHNFVKVGFVNGYGNSNSQKNYKFVDNDVNPGHYSYRLKQIDIDGSYSFSEIINVDVRNIPLTFSLEQNYPNPFNPSTKIKYSIPAVETHSDASLRTTLKVYDILGNEVSILVDEFKQAGAYEVEFDASSLASGFYIYKLTAGNFTSSKKMLLIK